MFQFLPEPARLHDTPAQIAVVLVNLGTPESPTVPALRRYLKQFLSDPRVVEIPRLLWWPILNGVILNIRPRKSAEKYAAIWTQDGSPLKVHTEVQAKLLGGLLGERGHRLKVAWAMRYGAPSLPEVLTKLKSQGVNRVLLLPMYPQYAASTTATVLDEVCAWLQRTRNQPEIRCIRNFHDDEGYLAALEHAVRSHWQQYGLPGPDTRLLVSFHGLPRRSLDLGDPYHCECLKTGRLLAERLNLRPEQYQISFQSRFGRAEWLQPYTATTLVAMAQSGIRRVDAICPGFVADCLETLEEIALEGRGIFLGAGGKEYHYIPALNGQASWINALADLVERHLQGWPTKISPCAETLAEIAHRARVLGASG